MASVADINDVVEGHVALRSGVSIGCCGTRRCPGCGLLGRSCACCAGSDPVAGALGRIGDRFGAQTRRFVAEREVPVLGLRAPDRFRWDDRKLDRVRPQLERAENEGRFGVVALVVGEELRSVWSAPNRARQPGRVPGVRLRAPPSRRLLLLHPRVRRGVHQGLQPGAVLREGLGRWGTSGPSAKPGARGAGSTRCMTGARAAQSPRGGGPSAMASDRTRGGQSATARSPRSRPAEQRGSRRRVPVRALAAPGRGLRHAGARRSPPRPLVL
jgi:hypothetical protein